MDGIWVTLGAYRYDAAEGSEPQRRTMYCETFFYHPDWWDNATEVVMNNSTILITDVTLALIKLPEPVNFNGTVKSSFTIPTLIISILIT